MTNLYGLHYHLVPEPGYEVFTHESAKTIRHWQRALEEQGQYWTLITCSGTACALYVPDSSGRLHSEDIRARIDSVRDTRTGVLSREEPRNTKRVTSWTSWGWQDDVRLSGG